MAKKGNKWPSLFSLSLNRILSLPTYLSYLQLFFSFSFSINSSEFAPLFSKWLFLCLISFRFETKKQFSSFAFFDHCFLFKLSYSSYSLSLSQYLSPSLSFKKVEVGFVILFKENNKRKQMKDVLNNSTFCTDPRSKPKWKLLDA
jgi:hypothetical protein